MITYFEAAMMGIATTLNSPQMLSHQEKCWNYNGLSEYEYAGAGYKQLEFSYKGTPLLLWYD